MQEVERGKGDNERERGDGTHGADGMHGLCHWAHCNLKELVSGELYKFPTGVGRRWLFCVVTQRVFELGTSHAQVDAGVERGDPRPGQVGLGIDQLDRGCPVRIEQLAANPVALLGSGQALLRRGQRVLGERDRLLRGEQLQPVGVLEAGLVGAQLVGLGDDPAIRGTRGISASLSVQVSWAPIAQVKVNLSCWGNTRWFGSA